MTVAPRSADALTVEVDVELLLSELPSWVELATTTVSLTTAPAAVVSAT